MNTLILYVIFSFYICDDHHYSFVNGAHVSKPLYTHLVTTFDSFTQPENFTNGTILIFSDLYQILDLDEKRGTITIKLTKVSKQCLLKLSIGYIKNRLKITAIETAIRFRDTHHIHFFDLILVHI